MHHQAIVGCRGQRRDRQRQTDCRQLGSEERSQKIVLQVGVHLFGRQKPGQKRSQRPADRVHPEGSSPCPHGKPNPADPATSRLPAAGPVELSFEQVADRAQVFVDGQPVGVLERERHEHVLSFTVPSEGAELRVLVENQGRVNYGEKLADRKGLLGSVYLNGTRLTGWSSRPLPLKPTELPTLEFTPIDGAAVGPCFHRAVFEVEHPADTYLHLDGWTKGVAWINGFNLGRYWSRGPQRSLYVPGPVLREGTNELVVFELHGARNAEAELRPTPDLGPTEL